MIYHELICKFHTCVCVCVPAYFKLGPLSYWGRVTHTCVSKLAIIGSDNGLSPSRRKPITWTNTELLLIRPLGTNINEILIEIFIFSFKNMQLKMSSGNLRPLCLGLSALKWNSNKSAIWFAVLYNWPTMIYMLANKLILCCRRVATSCIRPMDGVHSASAMLIMGK